MLLSPRRPDTSAFPRRPTPKRGTGEAIAIDRRRYRRRKCLWRHASPRGHARGHASWVSACHRADLAQPILHNCARELHALALPSMSRLASKSAYKPLKQPKNKIFHNIPYANRRGLSLSRGYRSLVHSEAGFRLPSTRERACVWGPVDGACAILRSLIQAPAWRRA